MKPKPTVQNWLQPRRWAGLGLVLAGLALAGADRLHAQANARPPERLGYQGYIAGSDGVPLGNSAPKNYDIIFRIYDGEGSTTPLWGEQQTVTVDKGNFSVALGEGAAVAGVPNAGLSLSGLFTGATVSERYIGFTVKGIGTGGADVDVLPRARLMTSPYAFLTTRALVATKLVQDNAGAADLITSTSNQVSVAGELTATRLTGDTVTVSNATLTGTISAATLHTGPLVVTNSLTLGPIAAANVAADIVWTSVLGFNDGTVTNQATTANVFANTSLNLRGKPVLSGASGWMPRILAGSTDIGNLMTTGVAVHTNGYTLSKIGNGVYRITYDVPFANVPTAIFTTHGYNLTIVGTRPIGSTSTYNQNVWAGESATGVEIVTAASAVTGSGALTDPGFDFVIIGP